MQRLKGRIVLFAALAALACSGDPTGNESTPTEIVASPEIVFVTQGDSQAVIVSVVDEDGQVLQADFTASNVGGGISVPAEPDPTYQEVTVGNPIRRQARFFVKGVDLTSTTFTVNALGLSKDIQVTVVPGDLSAEITDSLPALGDTVTITAPAGTFFSDASVLSFAGAAPVVVNQDATTITFIPFPNIDGPAVVSNVGVESNSTLVFTLATPYRVKTDSITDIGADVAPTTPALGGAVTLTLPAGLKLIPESLATLNIAGNPVAPRNAALSVDSSTITFVPPPNADSFVVVSGVIPQRLATCCASAGYGLLLGTTAKVTTPVVDAFPSTVSDASPAVNDVITLTSTDGNFTVDPAATVAVGAFEGVVTNRTANSISFTAGPGASGTVTVNGVVVAGFPLTLPSSAGAVTWSSTVTPLNGTDDPATAPSIAVPAVGFSTLLTDAGSYDYGAPIFGGAFGLFPSRLYKVVVPSDRDITITLDWATNDDLGAYWFAADGTTEPGFDPADDGGAGAHPETVTNTIPAGTYILAIVNFDVTSPQFTLRLDAE